MILLVITCPDVYIVMICEVMNSFMKLINIYICSRGEVANLVHRLEEMTTESTTEHNNMNELVDYYIYLYYVLFGWFED